MHFGYCTVLHVVATCYIQYARVVPYLNLHLMVCTYRYIEMYVLYDTCTYMYSTVATTHREMRGMLISRFLQLDAADVDLFNLHMC